MKKLLLTISLLLGVFSTSVTAKAAETLDYTKCSTFTAVADQCYWATVNANYQYSLAYEFLDAVNDYRETKGLDRLPTNDYCMRIAMQRALETNIIDDHGSPWVGRTGILGSLSMQAKILGLYAETGNQVDDTKMLLKFSAQEEGWPSLYAQGYRNDNYSILKEISSNGSDHGVLNTKAVVLGIGIVNDCIEVVAFKKTDLLEMSSDTRSLTDYTTSVKVPVNKAVVESSTDTCGAHDDNHVWHGDNGDYVTIDMSVFCDGTKNDDYEEEQEDPSVAETKAIKNTKVSGVKVSRKKAGKYTKITIKYNKVNKIKGIKYQIQVANNKNFKSAKKATTSSAKKTFSVNYKGKKAYIRVRCYKKVNGKTVYGKWSSVKTIKTYK